MKNSKIILINFISIISLISIFLLPSYLNAQWEWEPDINLTNDPAESYTSQNNARCVTYVGSNVHVVWSDNRYGNYEIFYKRSLDNGSNWLEDVRLTDNMSWSGTPSIAVNGSVVHVVWCDFRDEIPALYYKRSWDSGLNWEREIRLNDVLHGSFNPSMTVLGSNVYVVWADGRDQNNEIYYKYSVDNGTNWSEDIRLTNALYGSDFPSIAVSGSIVHVVWCDYRDDNPAIYYKHSFDNGLNWEREIRLNDVLYDSEHPSIAVSGPIVHVVWTDQRCGENEIYYKYSVDNGSNWQEDVRLTESAGYALGPSIAVYGSNVHIAWYDNRNDNYEIYYKFSSDNGTNWERDIRLTENIAGSWNPSIAVSGSIIHLVWYDFRDENYEIYYKRCIQIGPYANATFPNQGQHLCRTINTPHFCYVYEGNNNTIFWKEISEVLRPPALLDYGKYPSIAITSTGSSWVCYASGTGNEQSQKCRIKRSGEPYDWKEITICNAESIFAPSLVLAIGGEATPENMGYVVYKKKEGNSSYICFSAFDSLREEPYYTEVIDVGEDDETVLAPSISLTPGDLIHIVWQKIEHGGDISRIYYVTTLDEITPDAIRNGAQPTWSEPYEISTDDPLTKPASNPSVEAYGKYVYAVWRGPYNENNSTGEIWRRARSLGDPYYIWRDPENKSKTPANESNYPVMSTDFVTVWQESINDNNWDIWARFEPENSAQPIFETPTPSKYPHINGYWDPNPAVPPTFCVNTIWTEEFAPELFDVKFDCYRYEYNPNPEEKANLYYTVEIGDAIPSPFCSQRDGYVNFGQYKIDYGNQKLKYKLRYLHPSYYYDIRAIVYQQGQGNWSQEFDIDSTFSTTISFEPNQPETIWIRVPQQSYKNDTRVKQEIKKILGNRAAIADLRLYQKEEFTTNGGGPQSTSHISISRPILHQSYPNPTKSIAYVRYSLPFAGKVSLQLFDISGKLIKTIVDEYQNAGSYSLEVSNRKCKIPSGVYFYRLTTDNFSDTQRVVFIR